MLAASNEAMISSVPQTFLNTSWIPGCLRVVHQPRETKREGDSRPDVPYPRSVVHPVARVHSPEMMPRKVLRLPCRDIITFEPPSKAFEPVQSAILVFFARFLGDHIGDNDIAVPIEIGEPGGRVLYHGQASERDE